MRKKLTQALFALALILIVFSIIIIKNPQMLGYSIIEERNQYAENIIINFDKSGEYIWTPKSSEQIVSIKISGMVSKSGDAKLYINDKLAFDQNKILSSPSITGGVIDGITIMSNETNETADNETIVNETIVNETIVNETADNETIVNETIVNETILQEEEEEEEPEVETPVIPVEEVPEKPTQTELISFVEICEDTCSLEDMKWEAMEHTFKTEINGATLKITKITYETISKAEKTNAEEIIIQPEESSEGENKKEEAKIKENSTIQKIKIAVISISIIIITIILVRSQKKKKKKKKKR